MNVQFENNLFEEESIAKELGEEDELEDNSEVDDDIHEAQEPHAYEEVGPSKQIVQRYTREGLISEEEILDV